MCLKKDQADALYRAGNFSGAVEAYLESLAAIKGSDSSEDEETMKQRILSNLVACRLHTHQYDKALLEAQRCVECDPKWMKAHIRLAEVYIAQGNENMAMDVLGNTVLEEDPDNEAAIRMADELLKKRFANDINSYREKQSPIPAKDVGNYRFLYVAMLAFGAFVALLVFNDNFRAASLSFLAGCLVDAWDIHPCLPFLVLLGLLRLALMVLQKVPGGRAIAGYCIPILSELALLLMFVMVLWEPAPAPHIVFGGGQELYRTLNARSGATLKEITASYRRLALELHPDKVPPEMKEEAAKRFVKLRAAYDILKNEKLRTIYDGCGDIGLEAWDRGLCNKTGWETCCTEVTKLVETELGKMARDPQYYQKWERQYDEFQTYDHYYRHEF